MIALTFCFGLLVMWCDDPKKTVVDGWCKIEHQLERENRAEGRKPISRKDAASTKANHLARLRMRERRCGPKQPKGR